MSDSELLRAARAGDQAATEALISRYRPAVLATCRGHLRYHPDAVEDICQDTFVRLLRRLDRIDDPDKLKQWLTTVATNLCKNHRQRSERGLEVQSPETAVGDPAERIVERMAVRSILAGIGRGHAALLTAYYLEDRSVGRIESERGLAMGSGKVLMHRARRAARAFAEENGLRGLVPLPIARWLRQLQLRSHQVEPLVAVGGFAGNALLAAAIAISGVAGSSAVGDPQRWRSSGPDLSRLPLGVSLKVVPGRLRRSPVSRDLQEARAIGATGWRGEARVDPWVEMDTVTVPGTTHSFGTREPEGRPRYEVGFDAGAEVGPMSATGSIVNYDDPESADPAYDAACTAAETSPTLTYCRS
jgi:RNA polymerase sigma factor (sigma-70 family)